MKRLKFFKVLYFILEITLCVAYVVGGILLITLRRLNVAVDGDLLGFVIVTCGVLGIIKFFITKEANPLGLVSGILQISFGFIFIFSEMDIFHICLLWGLFEIIIGTLEAVIVLRDKHLDTKEVSSLIVAVSEVVFGTLLCIHSSGGIDEHLIYVGVTLIITSLGCIANMIETRSSYRIIKRRKKDKSDA